MSKSDTIEAAGAERRERDELERGARASVTPMMAQYHAAKKEQPDALLFFRMGDFYELFGQDAVTASRELGITLTAAKSRVQRARKDFVKTTRDCCAITVDARGRVTDLTPRNVPKAIECAACATGPDVKSGNRHEC